MKLPWKRGVDDAVLRDLGLAKIFLGISVLMGGLQLSGLYNGGIAHFAHLGGMLAGWYLVRFMGYGGPGFTYDQLWHPERHAPAEQPDQNDSATERERRYALWTDAVERTI